MHPALAGEFFTTSAIWEVPLSPGNGLQNFSIPYMTVNVISLIL